MTLVVHNINRTLSRQEILLNWKSFSPRPAAFPLEAHRIFLFIDMNNSTMLAERLGHLQYSMLLSSFFADFEACRAITGGEVYQFVGDEVIVSWEFSAKNIQKSLLLARVFNRTLQDKRAWYISEFGVAPGFKTAIHGGKVAITKIGNQKTYHGDVLNTCSRMIELASKLGERVIVSQKIIDALPKEKHHELPATAIRGKLKAITIFSISA